MMIARSRVLFRAVGGVMVRSARFSRSRNISAGGTLSIVPRAQEIAARKHELDHEERGGDARSTTIRHY